MSQELEKPEINQAEQLLAQINEIPLAAVLVDAFRKNSNPVSWTTNNKGHKNSIIGEIKTKQNINDTRTLVIEKFSDDQARLHIYTQNYQVEENPWGDASFLAGIVDFGQASQFTFGISLCFKAGYFYLPKREMAWLFRIVAEIANRSSEIYDPIGQQPRFWKSL